MAIELSREEKNIEITRIYRLQRTVDTPTLVECSGSSEWSNGRTVEIELWVEEADGGMVQYGYETE